MSFNAFTCSKGRCLFLGDLSIYCTEMSLQPLFQRYGPIESIIVKKGFCNRNQSKYGFITFQFAESAQVAMKELQGAIVLGRSIKIDFAQKKRANQNDRESSAQIQFSFISHQTAIVISEASLRDLFGRFGEVIDVMIKKSQLDKHREVQHGYGFIHYPMSFEGVHSALRAVQSIHQLSVGGVTFDTTLSTSLRTMIEFDNDLWKIWEKIQRDGTNKDSHSKVHNSVGRSSSIRDSTKFGSPSSEFLSGTKTKEPSLMVCTDSSLNLTDPQVQWSAFSSRSSSVYSADTTVSALSSSSFSPTFCYFIDYSK